LVLAHRAIADSAAEIAYEATPTGLTHQKRLVEHTRQAYYNSNSLPAAPSALPFGQVDALALPYETYALAFTPGLLTNAFGTRVTPTILQEGGYIDDGGLYWLPTGRGIFDPAKFYHATKVRDAFGGDTSITYDAYCLLVNQVEDALQNQIVVQNDYRVLGPVLVTDPNGNRSAAQIDELGMVSATAVMGKVGSSDGDTLADPTTTFFYDFDQYRTLGKPNFVRNVVREAHGAANTRWLYSYTYLDGLGGGVDWWGFRGIFGGR